MKALFILWFAFLAIFGAIGNDLPNANSADVDHVEERFVKTDDGSTSTLTDDHLPDRFSSGFLSYLDYISLIYSASNGSRSKRDADALSEYSNKLSTVARISNGISLTAGLINGNIPIDSVIGELLNLGDVKVADIVGFKKDKFDDLVKELEKAAKDLTYSDDVKKFEEGIIALEQMRKATGEIGDLTSFTLPTDYFDLIDTFDPTEKDIGMIASLFDTVSGSITFIEQFAGTTKIADREVKSIGAALASLKDDLARLEGVAAELPKFPEALKKYQGLSNPTSLQPFVKLINALSSEKPSIDGLEGIPTFTKNLGFVTSFSTKLDSSATDLALFVKLISRLASRIPQKRLHTSAFPNGASDLKLLVKDNLDPLVEQAIGAGKDFSKLSGGLKPLMSMSVKVETLGAKLRPISDAQIMMSAKNTLQLQSSMPNLKSTPLDDSATSEVIKSFVTCSFVPVTDLKKVPSAMEDIKTLGKYLESMDDVTKNWSEPPAVVKEVEQILSRLPAQAAKEDVIKTLNEFNSASSQVAAVKTYLTGLKDRMEGVPSAADFEALVNKIKNSTRADLEGFLKNLGVQQAVVKLGCIKDIKGPIGQMAKTVEAIQTIRKVSNAETQQIQAAAGIISQTVGSFEDLRLVPAVMKKEMTKDVKELIKMKDSQKTSATLGAVAWSIHNMDKLRSLGATISALEQDGKKVFEEIGKVKDQKQKAEMQKKWGDHKKFTNSLEVSHQHIEAFKSKVGVPKDLRQLGTPLEAAKTVSDVVGSVSDKSEALAMLLSIDSLDPNVKTELQGIKDHLDKLLPLDLQFSGHLSATKDVPTALTSLFNVLTAFLSSEETTKSYVDFFEEHKVVIIVVAIVASLAVILSIALVIVFMRKCLKRRKEVLPEKQPLLAMIQFFEKWKHLLDSEAVSAVKFVILELLTVGKDLKFKKKVRSKMRYSDTEVLLKTAVRLPDGRYIHANWMVTCEGFKFIATQGPLDGTEGKDDTRDDFLYMAFVNESEFIVQLCEFEERHFDPKTNTYGMKSKSGKYFPTNVGHKLELAEYTVETTELKEEFGGEVENRTLVITEKRGKKRTHTLTHLHHKAWPDKTVPENLNTVVKLVERVTMSKKPVIVHCSAGVGRTVTFIGVEIISRYVERYPDKRVNKVFSVLRSMRHRGMQTADQVYFCFIASFRLVLNRYSEGAEFEEVYQDHYHRYERVRRELQSPEAVPVADHIAIDGG